MAESNNTHLEKLLQEFGVKEGAGTYSNFETALENLNKALNDRSANYANKAMSSLDDCVKSVNLNEKQTKEIKYLALSLATQGRESPEQDIKYILRMHESSKKDGSDLFKAFKTEIMGSDNGLSASKKAVENIISEKVNQLNNDVSKLLDNSFDKDQKDRFIQNINSAAENKVGTTKSSLKSPQYYKSMRDTSFALSFAIVGPPTILGFMPLLPVAAAGSWVAAVYSDKRRQKNDAKKEGSEKVSIDSVVNNLRVLKAKFAPNKYTNDIEKFEAEKQKEQDNYNKQFQEAKTKIYYDIKSLKMISALKNVRNAVINYNDYSSKIKPLNNNIKELKKKNKNAIKEFENKLESGIKEIEKATRGFCYPQEASSDSPGLDSLVRRDYPTKEAEKIIKYQKEKLLKNKANTKTANLIPEKEKQQVKNKAAKLGEELNSELGKKKVVSQNNSSRNNARIKPSYSSRYK